MMTASRKRLAGVIALALWLAAGAIPFPLALGEGAHAGTARSATREIATRGEIAAGHVHEGAEILLDSHGCSHCTAACFEGHGHVCMNGGRGDAGFQNHATGTRSAPCVKGNPCSGGPDATFEFGHLQFRTLPPEEPGTIALQVSIPIPIDAATLASVLLSDPTPPPESARSNFA